jgi:glycosyltransferase involved in cell wall biosynthesis
MDAMYKEADVFVYHSEHDATPNVLLESKRWGLPVLLNEHKPFRAIVSDESSGLFYNDASTFHQQLNRLLKDKTLRQRLGERAAWEHENKFSIEAIAEKLENALFR